MPTVREVSDPLANICTAVPPAAEGVCEICHGRPKPGFETCYSCSEAVGQVTRPCTTVIPISLYEASSQLHHHLRQYKDSVFEYVRRDSSLKLGALLARFIFDHTECIERAAGGRWDAITTVPSSAGRLGEHPLIRAIGVVPDLRKHTRSLLVRGPGEIRHNKAADDGYVLAPDLTPASVDGASLLLVDDTYTSGARVQSAASAIQLAGGRVGAIITIGRVINPRFSDDVKAYWEAQRAIPFSFETCCVHL